MTNYNEQYYICAVPSGGDHLFVGRQSKTASGRFWCEKPTDGGPPLYFHNSNKENDLVDGNRWPITEVLYCTKSILVKHVLYEKLKMHKPSGMTFHPAVYIDDEGEWHDDYLYLVFHEAGDWWDRDLSDVEEAATIRSDGSVRPAWVEKFYLDENVLDKIPENNRLMFALGGATNRHVCFHKKNVEILGEYQGVRFLKMSEYEPGDECG